MHSQGLYDPSFERGSCGVGFVATINGSKSHQIINDGITILKNLLHRSILGPDQKTGDGAGILVQIPHQFFMKEAAKEHITLPSENAYGVGMIFLPMDPALRQNALDIINHTIQANNGSVLGWRTVVTKTSDIGDAAFATLPYISQVFIQCDAVTNELLERKLYLIRRQIERNLLHAQFTFDQCYICSLSSRKIVYKGMMVGFQLESFYPDLSDPDFKSSLAVVHQRLSTNTFPAWYLAQPFRYLCHNGEINSIRSNSNRMSAREATLQSDIFGHELSMLFPIVQRQLSDSGMLDNVYELIVQAGRSPEHTMMMMIPETFGSRYHISQDKRSFYEFHASFMEPWDGPAALIFTDGIKVGAALDRNGLRPLRYLITKSNKIIMASEAGALPVPTEEVLRKGRLGPGRMIMVDTSKKRLHIDNEIKSSVSRQKPYRRWIEQNAIELKGLFQAHGHIEIDEQVIILKQKLFFYSREDIHNLISVMAITGQEPVGSMNIHPHLAVLQQEPQLLYYYFKQIFAQVTHPPLDPYRENLVMSLMSFIGRAHNLLEETPQHCHQLKLQHPILTNEDISKLKSVELTKMRSKTVSIVFSADPQSPGLAQTISLLCHEAETAVDQGYSLLILSDRVADNQSIPIPALLATSSIHHFLVQKQKRHLIGLVVETAEAREVMHIALLIGYGASAVNPYLAFESIVQLHQTKRLPQPLSLESAIDNYITAIKKGILKIIAKMGISTIRSYRGAQLFEAVGLSKSFIDSYFPQTFSRIGGIGIEVIEQELRKHHTEVYAQQEPESKILTSNGTINARTTTKGYLVTAEAVMLLQQAVRCNDPTLYKKYVTSLESSTTPSTLRSLLSIKKGLHSIPLHEVEPAEKIMRRFSTAPMSYGSISKEAHEAIAVAMNRIGAMSNCGEGGEPKQSKDQSALSDSTMNKARQVASGRFGVTLEYLVQAQEIQIKISQGSKPGEGGHLPAEKVTDEIAQLRNCTPQVMLLSPPPHHDVSTIEDLAQLIYDLKNVNTHGRISVKLVSELGIGTTAAAVAKCKADVICISGSNGGTGAATLSSMHHAGTPWEIGLSEAHQTLILNNLRKQVLLQVDGKLRTGIDVVKAACFGAELFSFGTMPLVCLGCILMQKCHLNTCPAGIATQRADLRNHFTGKAEYIVNFMRFVAEEVREIMAYAGFRVFDELIGCSDILEHIPHPSHPKAAMLDFSKILYKPPHIDTTDLRCTKPSILDLSTTLDYELINKAKSALLEKQPINLFASIRTSDRSVGALLSSTIVKQHSGESLAQDSIRCKFSGSAGQSFGAFLTTGVTFELEGDANDSVGKSLSGGKIIITPPKRSSFKAHNNTICGNGCLYGATSGEVYINGNAGERFAVRNSGAISVVEGIGDHGCEYMTGGTVVVIGRTGINFAAGMSGGTAYVLDDNQLFDTRCNLEMVDIEPVTKEQDQEFLYTLIQNHAQLTGSEFAKRLLAEWIDTVPQFVKVIPLDYKRVIERMQQQDSKYTEVIAMTEEVYSKWNQ